MRNSSFHSLSMETELGLSVFQVALSQDDLTVLLRILMENIGEASGVQPDAQALKQESELIRTRTQTGERIQIYR